MHIRRPAGCRVRALHLLAQLCEGGFCGCEGIAPVLGFGVGRGLVLEGAIAGGDVDGAASVGVLAFLLCVMTWSAYGSVSVCWVVEAGAGGGAALTDAFFACAIGVFAAAPIAALVVVVDGRVPVVLVEAASDARGVARAVDASAAGRVVRGRLAVVVVEGAIDCRDVAFPGEDRVAAVAVPAVLRTAVVFLFSSPEVTDDSSGSASEAVARELIPVRLTAAPATGRVGGLFRLDPRVLTRDVEVVEGLDADAVEARAVLAVDDAAGRRAPTAAGVPAVVVGRRGGTESLLAEAPALEAMLRRSDDVGVEGAGNFFGSGL